MIGSPGRNGVACTASRRKASDGQYSQSPCRRLVASGSPASTRVPVPRGRTSRCLTWSASGRTTAPLSSMTRTPGWMMSASGNRACAARTTAT